MTTMTSPERRSRAGRAECTALGCGRPCPHAWLCGDCTDGLREDLYAVRPRLEDLEITLTRQDRIGEHSSGGTELVVWPLPWNDAASKAQTRLLRAVAAVAALWGVPESCDTGDHYCEPYGAAQGGNWVPLAGWLARRAPELAQIPRIGPAAGRLDRAVKSARTVCDLPSHTRRILVGPCPRSGVDGRVYCDGPVWALLPALDSSSATLVCLVCEHEWQTTQWRRAGRDILRRRAVLALRVGAA